MSPDRTGEEIAELEARIEELEQQVDGQQSGDISMSRRGVLGSLVGVGAAGAALGSLSEPASAQSSPVGQLGSDSDRIDLYGSTVDTEALEADKLTNVYDYVVDQVPLGDAFANLSDGESIHLGVNEYDPTSALQVTERGVSISGKSQGHQFFDVPGSLINGTDLGDVLTFGDPSATGSDVIVGSISDISVRKGDVGIRTYTGASHIERVLVTTQNTAGFVAEDAGASDQMLSNCTAKEVDGPGFWMKQGDVELSSCRAFEVPVGFQIERACTLISPKTYEISEYGIYLKDNDRLVVHGGNLATNNGFANLRLRVTDGGSSIDETSIFGTRFQSEGGTGKHIEVAVGDETKSVTATITGCTFESGCDAIEVVDDTGDVDILVESCYIGEQSSIPDGVKFRDCHGPAVPLVDNTGTETQSGDGSSTRFFWDHGLDRKPTYADIEPITADARGEYHIEIGVSSLTIEYPTAPPSGTDNLEWVWEAKDDR